MDALRDKFATQSNSVRRAFREVAQPGCEAAPKVLCVASPSLIRRQDRITKSQIRRLLHNLNLVGVGPKVVTELFNAIDIDGNGSIDYREFKVAFGEGICGGGYQGMDVFRGEESHLANVKSRSLRNGLREMGLNSAIEELRARMATQHMKVRTAFRALDRDCSGTLERGEMRALLESYHIKLSDADMDRLMAQIDTDGSGKISYREFNEYFGADIAGGKFKNAGGMESALATAEEKRAEKHEEARKECCHSYHQNWTTADFMNAMETIMMTRARTVRRIFRVADNDKSGCIDAQEWHAALCQMNLEMSPSKAKEFFDALDKNGDGRINYREFVNAFGDIVAGYRDTGIMTAHLARQEKAKAEFGNMMHQPRHVPKVPRYTVHQIKELVARRLGGKYKSACTAFRHIDMNKGGCLDKDELRRFIKDLNVELVEEDYEMLYRELDCDANGSINYDEFLYWFGEAICGAPWQANESTGLCTEGVPHAVNRTPKPPLLSVKEALRLLHVKLTENSTSVNKVFKRYNKGRSTKLSRKQFKLMFDNYHLHVNDEVITEIVRHLQRRHGDLPNDGSGVSFALFVKEFGKSIAGEAFVGVIDRNPGPGELCRELKPTPKCTAKEARAMLITKLITNFKHNRTAFTRFNLARDHAMSKDELRYALTHYHIHLSDAEFKEFVKEFDQDDNGIIDFREFISVVGAEVSGTQDNGLSVRMQAADDRQKERLKDLNKQLERQSFDHSESESESEIDEEGRHHHFHIHHHKGDRRLPKGVQYHTPTDEVFEQPESHCPSSTCYSNVNDNLAFLETKTRRKLQHAIMLANQETVPGDVRWTQAPIITARRSQQALRKARCLKDMDQATTNWDIAKETTSSKVALHSKHWRNPPARHFHRAVSEPLIITHR